jgi:cell fate regulator YaaT (PSP1 superfamily)
MQLLDADLSFDEKKLTFYFTAPSRVDFRVLVSELAHTFKKIIRLQQIGSRDEARYLGGVGRCGETICCKKFLKGNLESVTLDMASDQNLAQMGSNRITGVCGKLMCCLKYELEYYQKVKKTMPALGTEINTEKGKGTVIGQNIVKKKVTVKLNEGGNILEVDC